MTKLEQFYNMAKRSNNFDEFQDAVVGVRDREATLASYNYRLDCASRKRKAEMVNSSDERPTLKINRTIGEGVLSNPKFKFISKKDLIGRLDLLIFTDTLKSKDFMARELIQILNNEILEVKRYEGENVNNV